MGPRNGGMMRGTEGSAPALLLLGLVLGAGEIRAGERIRTGPGIGERVPDFEVRDQNGEARNLGNLVGPNGLLLLFHRSVDW